MATDSRRFGVVAVILRGSEFLVIQRSQFVSAPGAYCFPGGGIESGETEQQALVRELGEELEIFSALPIRRIWHSVTRRNVDLAWWLTEFPADESPIANPEEVAEIRWWSVERMLECGNLLDSNREFLRQLELGNISVAT